MPGPYVLGCLILFQIAEEASWGMHLVYTDALWKFAGSNYCIAYVTVDLRCCVNMPCTPCAFHRVLQGQERAVLLKQLAKEAGDASSWEQLRLVQAKVDCAKKVCTTSNDKKLAKQASQAAKETQIRLKDADYATLVRSSRTQPS